MIKTADCLLEKESVSGCLCKSVFQLLLLYRIIAKQSTLNVKIAKTNVHLEKGMPIFPMTSIKISTMVMLVANDSARFSREEKAFEEPKTVRSMKNPGTKKRKMIVTINAILDSMDIIKI